MSNPFWINIGLGWRERLTSHQGRVSTHLLTPTAHWLEYAEWFNPIIDPLRLADGCGMPDESPDSGIEWKKPAIARYLVE